MEHIAALLLIVGCSQDMKQCEELPSPVTVYETAGECDAELPAALRQLDGRKPRVMGTCVYVDPAMEEEDAELVWDVTPNGALRATVEAISMNVASVTGNTLHE
nr:hypothetical protein [Mesorhizobium sp.]